VDEVLAVASALGDRSRLRAFLALRRTELCVCQLTELLVLAPSTVSRHLAILKQAGLVRCRKEGRWIFYRALGEDAPRAVRKAAAWAADSLAGDPTAIEDERRLAEITRIPVEVLCHRKNGS